MSSLSKIKLINTVQVLRNDPVPAIELAVERDLSSFSRFTRDRSALLSVA